MVAVGGSVATSQRPPRLELTGLLAADDFEQLHHDEKPSVVALAHRFDVSEGNITRLFEICRSGSSP
ncbi:hypothetical protein PV416_34190 [Streptomyces ipomoeae]|uniref:hypothetical protein n=1 Tax=Streptomyces ipomoeae TaxID=103232 RepID=UPI0029A703B2|nr:hypothetical protein [Streptomyces ipomoeae]MDX2825985.1 hypothetical protein [Streptomyces ipomoeae]MDX2878701.1 hypothetical protein [Streptomyces ipomoeae]